MPEGAHFAKWTPHRAAQARLVRGDNRRIRRHLAKALYTPAAAPAKLKYGTAQSA